ncbi:hypothetical protein OFM04_36140, partial [Escherichia coli]|nr:hypothetical protein [Escherichia coli]
SDPLAPGRLEAAVAEELRRGPLRAEAVAAPATLVGGAVRLSPVAIAAGAADWRGAATFDLKSLTLDARGILSARTVPKG